MLPLTNKELKSHEAAKVWYICEKYFIKKLFRDLNYRKVRHHFRITKELANEFEGRFECTEEDSEIYKNFSDLIKKEVIKFDKYGKKSVETISYKIKFIDSMRFMATSLAKLEDDLSEGIHKIECKDCGCSLKHESVKNNFIKYKCFSCNKNYSEKLNEEL